MAFRFEKLDVWHRAIDYYSRICEASERFPQTEHWGLRRQLRNSALSISLNIAEACGRKTKTEFARFIDIARGSLFETISNLYGSRKRGFLGELMYSELYAEGEEISKMLAGLKNQGKHRDKR